MTGNDAARAFLESITGYADDEQGDAPSHDRPVKLGVVDPAYAGTGEARVKFDGESVMGVRTYVALLPVAAGDRVVMLPVGRTYVVLGSVGGLELDAGGITSGTLSRARGGTGVSAASLTELKAALGIPFAMASGKTAAPASSSVVGGNVYYSNLSVTFPVGRFTVPPNVTLGPVGHSGSVSASGFQSELTMTTTSFAARVLTFAAPVGSGASLRWTAIQMTESSADG